jgi:hypothetical protein
LSNPLGIYDSLRYNLFADSAVVPQFKTIPVQRPHVLVALDTIPPMEPQNLDFYIIGERLTLVWQQPEDTTSNNDISYFIIKIYQVNKQNRKLIAQIKTQKEIYLVRVKRGNIFTKRKKYAFEVYAVDKAGNRSNPSKKLIIKLKEIYP